VRVLIFCLMFVSVPLFGESGFELWLEGGMTSNSVTLPWSGKSDAINARLLSLRALWTYRQYNSGLTISCGLSRPAHGWQEKHSGSVPGPGVIYVQTIGVRYEPSLFFGLHYRAPGPGKTSFSFGADLRHSRAKVSGGEIYIGFIDLGAMEFIPSMQLAWNVFNRVNIGARLGYRFQLHKDMKRAEWYDIYQNNPEYCIVVGWRFGRS